MNYILKLSDNDLTTVEAEALSADRLAEREDFLGKDEHLALWASEAKRRSEELRSGAVKGIPVDEVFEELRREFGPW